jgi:hypothetical protein
VAAVRIARVAPVGVLASVINDVGLRDLLNARLVPDAPAGLTPGAAGARMIRQGLGCAHRPRSWTPPGCAHPPRARWGRDGLRAALGHRWTRGRTGDAADAEGGARRLPALARAVGAHPGVRARRPCGRHPSGPG